MMVSHTQYGILKCSNINGDNNNNCYNSSIQMQRDSPKALNNGENLNICPYQVIGVVQKGACDKYF